MENVMSIPVSTLEHLIELNEADVILYREAGVEHMASWCEGKISGYRTLINVYGKEN